MVTAPDIEMKQTNAGQQVNTARQQEDLIPQFYSSLVVLQEKQT